MGPARPELRLVPGRRARQVGWAGAGLGPPGEHLPAFGGPGALLEKGRLVNNLPLFKVVVNAEMLA